MVSGQAGVGGRCGPWSASDSGLWPLSAGLGSGPGPAVGGVTDWLSVPLSEPGPAAGRARRQKPGPERGQQVLAAALQLLRRHVNLSQLLLEVRKGLRAGRPRAARSPPQC